MGSSYVRKTDRRRYEDRKFSIRAAHRDPVDLHKLAEVLIRLTLQETGQTRAIRRNQEHPDTYRADPTPARANPIPVPVSEGQVE
ncbi:hypothetical protein [Microbacterium lacticum]